MTTKSDADVAGGWPEQLTTVTPDSMRTEVEANVIGVIRVTNAMLPLPLRSAQVTRCCRRPSWP